MSNFEAFEEELTPRERQVVRLVAQGLTSHEIAKSLFISVSTVKFHLKHATAKFGVSERGKVAARFWISRVRDLEQEIADLELRS